MTSIVDGSNPARAHSRSHRRLACRLVAMGCAFDVAVVTARPHPGAALRRRRAAPGRASAWPGSPDGLRRVAPLLDRPGPRCLHYLAKAADRVIVRNSASVKIKHEEPNGG